LRTTRGSELLLYVYAVLAADSPSIERLAKGPLLGLEGGAVRAVVEGGLAAVISDVPELTYEEEPLNERLRDLEWLSPRASLHQQVNDHLLERAGALLPLSFGVVYRGEESLRGMLRSRQTELLQRLEQVRDRAEWILTLHREDGAALADVERSSDQVRRVQEQVESSGPGRAYLLRRRLGELRRSELLELDASALRALGEVLGDVGARIFREPVPDSVERAPVARLSLLVRRDVERQLEAGVDRFNQLWSIRGYLAQLSGPWPPYRFGSLDAEATVAGI
jgi:hypothetical protein